MSVPLALSAESFRRAVLESDRPVLVDFWAEWCPPCRAIAPVVERLAADYQGRAAVAKVDVDADPELARAYDVRSIPSLLFFRDGEVVDRVIGAAPRGELTRKLDRLLEAAP